MDGSNIVEGEFHVNNLFWLKVSCINCFPLGEVVIFSIKHIVHGDWFTYLGKCFYRWQGFGDGTLPP